MTVTGLTANTTFTASYSNVSDTCTVTVSNILWQPAMDGTDSMSNFGTGTRYVNFTDGVCTCAKYCFDDDWDNSIDWEMTFDLNCNGAYSNANNGVEIIDSTQTAPDHYCLAILADSKYFTNYIPTTTAVGETISNIAKNTWVSIRVTKVGTTLTVYFNDTLFETYTNCEWSRSKLAFHSWSSNYTQVKNIIVESL